MDLLHNAMAVRLDGSLRRAQFAGDLLVHPPLHHPVKDLPFARAEVIDQHPQLAELPVSLFQGANTPKARSMASSKTCLSTGLVRRSCAGLDHVHSRRDVRMTCQEDDRQGRFPRVQARLQFRPGQPGHLDVKEDAAWHRTRRGAL